MFSRYCVLSQNQCWNSTRCRPPAFHQFCFPRSCLVSFPIRGADLFYSLQMASVSCSLRSCSSGDVARVGLDSSDLDRFSEVGNQIADAGGEVLCKYFCTSFDTVEKEDLSPATIADRDAEEVMVKILQENFPSHAIYGEENGWRCKENSADFVWVLDPIDGTNSFITGKPSFGTLIALLYKSRPILGIINQPVLKERWIGIIGRKTTLNEQVVSTRKYSELSKAYLYTTSPHLFSGEAEVAIARVRNKVKLTLYGCDCYAYALLATGFVDLVVESGLKPYNFLALILVIEGAGGVITDWKGHQLHWEASPNAQATSFNVIAAGNKLVHQEALDALQWKDDLRNGVGILDAIFCKIRSLRVPIISTNKFTMFMPSRRGKKSG